MHDIINVYGTSILRIIALILWWILLKKHKFESTNRLSIIYFISFFGIFILWNFSMIISKYLFGKSNEVYLVFWVIASVFELFFITKILFLTLSPSKPNSDIFPITVSVITIPIILAAILSYTNRSYNPINTTDFFNIILLLLGTIVILRNLLIGENFLNNIESFFIFSGFALYFVLHILASNSFSLGFLENWNFGKYATIVSLIYWLGSLFFIWKIRSRHLS
ncbi:MAG: hypothetical protein B1H06_02370 [Candidatus Cloacimonas sp. 4484_143]|nr:MAG: hypothetical protein B1H06_02370 [Candidatus Cloacimonas sp. 4484_143]RLC50963.1 MAG: hypothetical protein DRH79_06895 [Candidatus Cloacimonadota bacterium]